MSSVSSTGLASSLERLNCYERTLPKGLAFIKSKFGWNSKRKEDKKICKDTEQVKASLVNALENGLALSKYQARMAFSVYLQHVQRRLMIGCDQEKQTDLVYRFLRSATRTLHLPINIQAPSKNLPQEARAVVISKQLGDFIQAYTKETHLYVDQQTSASSSSLSSQCPTSSVPTPSEPVPSLPISSGFSQNDSSNSYDSKENEEDNVPTEDTSYFKPNKDLAESFSLTSKANCRLPTSIMSLLSVNNLSDSSTTLSSINIPESVTSSVSRQPSVASIHGSSVSGSLSPSFSSSTSLYRPSTSSASSSSISTIDEPFHKRAGFFQSKLRRFKSEGYSDDEVSQSSKTTKESSENAEPGVKEYQRPTSSDQEDGIEMELYRAFLSNAGEADLEEVLSLQTRIHNSAGVFLDPARRLRSHHSSASSSNTIGTSGSTSRPRTPAASPHGSPRRSRRSPIANERGSQTHLEEPVTVEPHTSNQPIDSSTSKEMKRSPSQCSSGAPPLASTVPSSSCCLFGNILKASLRGTKTTFHT